MAAQVLSAITATPFEIVTTSFTPGIDLARAASNDATLPPKTGHRATTAYSIPGNRTSIPNVALPSTFDGVSRRLGEVPIKWNCFGSFNITFAGFGSLAAASARLPKLSRDPEVELITKPFSA